MTNRDTADATLGNAVESEAALPQVIQDTHLAVKFDNGNYYTGAAMSRMDSRESDNIAFARTYMMEWQIPKDLYLQQYLFGKDRKYEVVTVRVTKTYEEVSPKAIESNEYTQAVSGLGLGEDNHER